jgi:hypothetical protein
MAIGSRVMAGVALAWVCAPSAMAQQNPLPPTTQQNPIFNALLEGGVALGGGPRIRLPVPTLPAGLGAQAQRQALSKITDENHPLAALQRKAVVAPFVLRIKDEPPAGTARPRRVDFWFVAYGNFDRLSDQEFLNQVVDMAAKSEGSESSGEAGALTDDQLSSRNIAPETDKRYVAANFTLFDRVKVSGVMQAMLSRAGDSVVVAAVQDPRFDKDPKYPNAWRSMSRDAEGRLTVGKPQPYSGAAWYCKATRLAQPEGAAFIEYHVVFDEPEGWFNGANLLRSKLPLVVQDGIRKFRRRFASETKGS